jgi:hypothetical protein
MNPVDHAVGLVEHKRDLVVWGAVGYVADNDAADVLLAEGSDISEISRTIRTVLFGELRS